MRLPYTRGLIRFSNCAGLSRWTYVLPVFLLTSSVTVYGVIYMDWYHMHIYLFTSVTVYGGIYMDWDQVVLRSLDDLRNYDLTMVRSSKKGF